MSTRRVLIVGDEGVALFLTNGKKIERECSLPWMVPHFEDELIDILKNKNFGIPVFILYDALEQQYRKEDIIKTNILDQKKLINRKLGSLFPNVLSYSYIELKDKKKRGEKQPKKTHLSYLIAAVPNTEQMQRVEYAISKAHTDIAGFALLPVESSGFAQAFAKKLPHKDTVPRWALIISHHETGGLRQIFIKDGTLALTRLTPLSDDASGGTHWAEEVYKGFTTTLSYISRFGFSPADGLDVIVICNDQNKSLLQTYDFKGANLHCYSIVETGKLFGFSMPIQKNLHNQHADLLHAGWIARQRTLKMPFSIEWIQRIIVPRRTAKIATLILFISMMAAATLSLDTWQKFESINDDIAYKVTQRTVLEEEYVEESKIFDTLPIRPITIHAALETKEGLDKASMYSYPLLEKIQSVLIGKANLLKISYLDARDPEGDFKKIGVYVPPQRSKRQIKRLQITVRFTLDNALAIEERVKAVDSIRNSFETAFPKRQVRIAKQYGGNIIDAGAFTGKLGGKSNETNNPAPQTVTNDLENYAEISISGEHL